MDKLLKTPEPKSLEKNVQTSLDANNNPTVPIKQRKYKIIESSHSNFTSSSNRVANTQKTVEPETIPTNTISDGPQPSEAIVLSRKSLALNAKVASEKQVDSKLLQANDANEEPSLSLSQNLSASGKKKIIKRKVIVRRPKAKQTTSVDQNTASQQDLATIKNINAQNAISASVEIVDSERNSLENEKKNLGNVVKEDLETKQRLELKTEAHSQEKSPTNPDRQQSLPLEQLIVTKRTDNLVPNQTAQSFPVAHPPSQQSNNLVQVSNCLVLHCVT